MREYTFDPRSRRIRLKPHACREDESLLRLLKDTHFRVNESSFAIITDYRGSEPYVYCVRSRNRRDLLHLPGGKVERDETPIYALDRELKEELGMDKPSLFHLTTRLVTYEGELWREHYFVCHKPFQIPDPAGEIAFGAYLKLNDLLEMQEYVCYTDFMQVLPYLKAGFFNRRYEDGSRMMLEWLLDLTASGTHLGDDVGSIPTKAKSDVLSAALSFLRGQ